MPQPLSPGAWLAQFPLLGGEQLFAVLGSTSEAGPLAAWHAAAGMAPRSIWAGTAYAEWNEVMPYVAIVAPDSRFLDWWLHPATDGVGWRCHPASWKA